MGFGVLCRSMLPQNAEPARPRRDYVSLLGGYVSCPVVLLGAESGEIVAPYPVKYTGDGQAATCSMALVAPPILACSRPIQSVLIGS